MNAQELISRLGGEGCFVFGTGFVAKLFKAALEKAGMYDCVRGYLVTSPAGERFFDGFGVRAVDDAETDRSALICIAVHESNLATVQETLCGAGFDNTVWVYPYLYDLIYGEPLYRNVDLPLEMILRVQNPRHYWLAVRALAAQGMLSGSEDGFDTYQIDDFECWGNAYGAYPVEIFVNGELGIYCITPDDFERFRDGYTVRLYRRELAPLFVLPSFYKFVDGYELDGTKGTLYWLCDEPDAEKVEEMTSFGGCKMLNSRCQYAPEIKSKVVFVPNGTPFSFC